jgi:hypothetical protein
VAPPSKVVPRPRTPERKALAEKVWTLLDNGSSFRDVAAEIGVNSLAMVSRLRDEHTRNELTEEVRANELADLSMWNEMLNEAAELTLASETPWKMADLAKSRATLSRERRMILGIDKPIQSKLTIDDERGAKAEPVPLGVTVKEYYDGPIHAEMQGEIDRE